MISLLFRLRMKTAKEELKKSMIDNICRQVDSLFVGLINELETESIKEEKSCWSSTDTSPDLCGSETEEIAFCEKENVPPKCHLTLKPMDLHGFEGVLYEQNDGAASDYSIRCKAKLHKERQFKTIRLKDKQVNCPIEWCDRIFFKRHEFVHHFRESHCKVNSLSCTQCQTILFRPWDMFMHELLYHNEGLFGCTKDGCPFLGTTRSVVLAHYDQIHLGRVPPRSMNLHYTPVVPFEQYQNQPLSPEYGYDSNLEVVRPNEIYDPLTGNMVTDLQMSGYVFGQSF